MNRLGKESVSQAWGAIAMYHLLDGFPDPRKPADSQEHTVLDMCLARQLKTYGIKDLPISREKAPLWESFTPSSPQKPDPPTPDSTTSPT